MCKGTVRAGNKRYSGDIDLDLDPGETSLHVRVSYIPLSARMEGSRFDGRRVQFHLGFTLDKGYEAYNVRRSKIITAVDQGP